MRELVNILQNYRYSLGEIPVSSDSIKQVQSDVLAYSNKYFPQDNIYEYEINRIATQLENNKDELGAAAAQKNLIDKMIADAQALASLDAKERADYVQLKNKVQLLENEKDLLSYANKASKSENDALELQKSGLKERLLSEENQSKDKQAFIEQQQETIRNLDEQINNHKAEKLAFEQRDNILNNELISLRAETSNLKEFKQKHEIAKNSLKFHEQAIENRKNSKLWMAGVISAIILFVYYIFSGIDSNEELFNVATKITSKAHALSIINKQSFDADLITKLVYAEIGKKVAAKLLIYSMIIYFISFLVKNYNAQMHNFVTNSHKANALSSTVDLIGTAKQDDGNDKILVQATQAIFTTQRSGYQGADNEPKSPNLITNVIETITGGKKE